MARGFESKDVEFQQAEAERVKPLGRERSAEERAADARRRSSCRSPAPAPISRARARPRTVRCSNKRSKRWKSS
jgi:hypothetical protein